MRLMGIEAVYPKPRTSRPHLENGRSLRVGLAKWIKYYNLARGHSSLDDKTPDEVYFGLPYPFAEAA